MKSSKLIDIYKDGNVVIPLYMLKNYKSFNISLEEFVFLMYLYSKGNKVPFDPMKFAEELNVDLEQIMDRVSVLRDKNLLKIDVSKNENKVIEEVIDLEDFYSKLSLMIMEESNNSQNNVDSNVFEIIEKEFGRSLGSTGYEIVSAWMEDGISEELILEALKEASLNGVFNLRYIDKILYEWQKDGVKTKEDVTMRQMRRNRKLQKEEKDENDIDLDIMEWDWFDDEE